MDGGLIWGHVTTRSWQLAAGKRPFILEMYAWQVMQCMLNRAYNDVAPDLRFYSFPHIPGAIQDVVNAPVAMANMLPVWNAAGRFFEPATFRSYSWSDDLIVIPTMANNARWWFLYDGPLAMQPHAGITNIDHNVGLLGRCEPAPAMLLSIMSSSEL